jgi:hypothetical protein
VHGDCLNPFGPALQAHPGAPAIWVWDDELLQQWRISLKRILFIYECLLELPVVIRRGSVTEEIVKFAQEQKANTIVTTESPSPRFQAICEQLRQLGFSVETHPVEPFLDYDGQLDLRRFSRYWRVAQKHVFD